MLPMMKKSFLRYVCCLSICTVMSYTAAHGAGVFAEHYNAAQEYLMQNQYSNAIVEFRKALKINYMDNSARIGLINSYLARATYHANQTKDYGKAADDFRSAIFYLNMYPSSEQAVQNSIGMVSSASSNLNQCLKVLSFDTTPGSRYKKAEDLRAIGNLSAAAYEFNKAAESDKYKSDSYSQIGDIVKILGNEQRSVYYYKKAIDSDPNNGNLRMKYARTLDKIGQYDDAVAEYNTALANARGDIEVLYSLERIYLKKLAQTPSDAELNANIGAIKQAQGDFESALSYYAKAEQLNPSNVTTRINVGTLFQQKKEYGKALQSYDSVLTLYPNNTQALFYKAQTLSEMGNKKDALEIYKKVAALEPENKAARNEITNIVKSTMSPNEYITYLNQHGSVSELYEYAYKLHKENKIDNAITAYKNVLLRDSSNPDVYANLAICYAANNDYAKAISVLNEAKTKFPSNNTIAKTLKDVQKDSLSTQLASASANFETKNYKQAIKDYMQINPPTEDSLIGIGASYQALNDYDNAILYYKKAETVNPKNAEIPYYIGYLYSEQQNWSMSELYLKKAVQLNPDSEAKNLLTYVKQSGTLGTLNEGINMYEKKDFEKAISKFNDVIKNDATNAFAYYYRGLIYDEQKQTKLAISDYLNVLKNSKEFPIANYLLAIDYDSLNNYKEAFKYYKNFTANYSTDDEYLKYAKGRMEELKSYAG